MARTLGAGYHPVSFYYLYGDDGAVQAMIAEVTKPLGASATTT